MKLKAFNGEYFAANKTDIYGKCTQQKLPGYYL